MIRSLGFHLFGGRDKHGLNKSDYIIIHHYIGEGQKVNAVKYVRRVGGRSFGKSKLVVTNLVDKLEAA